MKIVLGVILLLLCIFIGYTFSKKYSDRRKSFEKFKDFNARVKNEVAFSQASLISVIKNLPTDMPINAYINDFFIKKEDNAEKLKTFTDEEKTFIKDYVKTLGQGDRASQGKFLDAAEKQLEKYLAAAEEEDKKYRPLCLKLGFLFGLIILIIML